MMLVVWYSLQSSPGLLWSGWLLDEEGWGKLSEDRLGWKRKVLVYFRPLI